jgi:hemolysin activation/secretion protein
MRPFFLPTLLTACLLIGNSPTVLAQVAIPSTVDAGRLDDQLAPPPVPAHDLKPKEKPQASAPVFSDAEEGFVLRDVTFEGNTAFSDASLRARLAPYIGRRIDEERLQLLADYLSNYYRQQGYFLSKVVVADYTPESGSTRFLSIEGYVAQIDLDQGNVDLSRDWQDNVRKSLDKITRIKPLHGPSLEREILLLNDLYGLSASTTLVPLQDMPDPPVGGVGMIVTLEKEKRVSSIEYNNFGSVYAGPSQNIYTLNVGTPLYAFDNFRLQLLHAFPIDEARHLYADYSIPLGESGLKATASIYKSWLRPTQNLKIFDLESSSEGIGLSLSYPFIRSRAENLYGFAGFDARNSTTDIIGTDLFDDRVRSIHVGMNYEFLDRTNGVNVINTTLTQGLNIFGASETGSLNLSREEGRSDFTKINISAVHSRTLSEVFHVVGGIAGQFSPTPLLSSEEFGYGGPTFGRAYDSSEITGDSGLSGYVEFRYAGMPPVESISLETEPYVFYDIGKVWNEDRDQTPESGASAGIGTRLWLFDRVSGNAGIAVPLTRRAENPIHGSGQDPRLFLQIGTQF